MKFSSSDVIAEMGEDHHLYLSSMAIGTGILAFFLAGLYLVKNEVAFGPLAWLIAALGLPMVFRFVRADRLKTAAWIYVFSLIGVLGAMLHLAGLQPAFWFLPVLPILAAYLTLSRSALIPILLATFITLMLVGLGHAPFGTVLAHFGFSGLVCLILVGALYVKEGSYLTISLYALDIQQKDTRRAESFYEQKVQLEEALRQLRHTKAELEWANTQLSEAQRHTQKASQAKSIFLSNVSHELRTPLNVVIGYSNSILCAPQMFGNVPLPPVYQPYIKLIEDNGHHLLGLINDILDLSKVEAGKLDIQPEPVNLPEMFNGVLATAIGLIKEKPVQLRPDFPDDLPLVWADRMRVRQVLLNLLSNAIKFTATGSVTLFARLEGQQVRIAVIDTGIGIPEQALATIFDRFQQAGQDTERRYGGTGLGLDISKRLVAMHGGDLKAESVVNQGSTFSFSLSLASPAQLVPGASTPDLSSPLVIFEEPDPDAAPMQAVLLVVDDASMRGAYREALEVLGIAVIEAAGDMPIAEMASIMLPDVIILETRAGESILQTIREDANLSQTAILFCAETEPSSLSQSAHDLFARRPMTVDILVSCVQHFLQSQVSLQKGITEV